MLWRFQNTNPSFEILGFVALNSRSHWDVLVTRLGLEPKTPTLKV